MHSRANNSTVYSDRYENPLSMAEGFRYLQSISLAMLLPVRLFVQRILTCTSLNNIVVRSIYPELRQRIYSRNYSTIFHEITTRLALFLYLIIFFLQQVRHLK